jgi:hypothetical protein
MHLVVVFNEKKNWKTRIAIWAFPLSWTKGNVCTVLLLICIFNANCDLKLRNIFFMQTILQAKQREKLFDIQRKPLPLEPSFLLREANRRRAFLSVGNISELYDSADG